MLFQQKYTFTNYNIQIENYTFSHCNTCNRVAYNRINKLAAQLVGILSALLCPVTC